MNPTSALGTVLLSVGLAGYGAGIAVDYPGRAFSITAVIVGIALVAIGPSMEEPT